MRGTSTAGQIDDHLDRTLLHTESTRRCCSACVRRLHGAFTTSHLLDFQAAFERSAKSEAKQPPALFMLIRMCQKHYFRCHPDAHRQRERASDYPRPNYTS